MKILKDADEYVTLHDWARKTVAEIGEAGAEKLRVVIDRTIKELPSGNPQAFDIDRLEGMSSMLTLALNQSRVKSFMVERDKQEQRRKRGKRQKWNALTREQLTARNQRIVDDFKKTRLTSSSFANKHAAKYGLSPRSVRLILQKGSWHLTG